MSKINSLEEALEVGMTPKQKEIFMVIDAWWAKFGFGPSVDDIMRLTGDKGRGNVARLYHASDMLRHKLMEVLDRHIPHLDEGCKERGCPCYEPEKS